MVGGSPRRVDLGAISSVRPVPWGRYRTTGSPPRLPGALRRLRPPRAAAHVACVRARSLSAFFSRVSATSARSPRSPGSEAYPGCHLTPGRSPRPRGLSWSRPPPGAASLCVRVRTRAPTIVFSHTSAISARSPRFPGSEAYPGCRRTPGRSPRLHGVFWSARSTPGAAALCVRV